MNDDAYEEGFRHKRMILEEIYTMPILEFFFTRHVFNILEDRFKLQDTEFKSYQTYKMWASILVVFF